MKRIITSTLAALFAVGTITTAHASPTNVVMREACFLAADSNLQTGQTKSLKSKRKSPLLGGFDADDDVKKETIRRIQEIEDSMQHETALLSGLLEEKRELLNERLNDDNLSDVQRKELKAKFYSENEELIGNLDELRRPFLDEIKKVQKNYVDCLIMY